jgi:hypothetical protein
VDIRRFADVTSYLLSVDNRRMQMWQVLYWQNELLEEWSYLGNGEEEDWEQVPQETEGPHHSKQDTLHYPKTDGDSYEILRNPERERGLSGNGTDPGSGTDRVSAEICRNSETEVRFLGHSWNPQERILTKSSGILKQREITGKSLGIPKERIFLENP